MKQDTIAYIKEYLAYRRMLKALSDEPKEKRERIMQAYGIKKPAYGSRENITVRSRAELERKLFNYEAMKAHEREVKKEALRRKLGMRKESGANSYETLNKALIEEGKTPAERRRILKAYGIKTDRKQGMPACYESLEGSL